MMVSDHSYSDTVKNAKVAIFGIEPPPLGGVSVHIQRVMNRFLSQNNKLFFFATEQWMRTIFPLYVCKLAVWLMRVRPEIVYYHSSYLFYSTSELVVIVLLRFFLKYEVIIVDHDCRHLSKKRVRQKRMYAWVTSKVNHVVCIGAATYQSYLDHGIDLVSYSIESAFIPPPLHAKASIQATYPSSLDIFMQEHTPLFLMSAAHLMLIDGKDVYGIDATIEMLGRLKQEYPDAGLIIGLAQIGNGAYFSHLQNMMKLQDVSESIFILHGNKELWPLYERVDLFLRPTLSDGDSISIREALFLNAPVVASDVTHRPSAVLVYGVGESDAYLNTVLLVLQEYIYGTKRERSNLHQKSFR